MKHSLFPILACTTALGALVGACSTNSEGTLPMEDEGSFGSLAQREEWDPAGDPLSVDERFSLTADSLPTEGRLDKLPIPGPYWPIYQDGINYRWDGDNPSPAEKFGEAFGLGAEKVALAVSRTSGVRAYMSGANKRKSCSTSSDECSSEKDSSVCGIPRGETKGACIPTWWGICHGWAPYAISEPLPLHEVTRNGVTFYPGDIVALMSAVYTADIHTAFLAERCDEVREKVESDVFGRATLDGCRDMNPGTLHVLVANRLGRQKKGFVYDRSAYSEVWNQPVFGFRVTNAENGRLKEIDRLEALKMLGRDVEYQAELQGAVAKSSKPVTGTYTARRGGELVFKAHGRGDLTLFLKKGSKATMDDADCTATTSYDPKECRIKVKRGDRIHYLVSTYEDSATFDLSVGRPTRNPSSSQPFSDRTRRYYYVELDLDYSSEGGATREAPVPDDNTLTDHYSYILEADARGRILGGEWVGESLHSHPDFVWWTLGPPSGAVAQGMIHYEEVKRLNDEAARPLPPRTSDPLPDTALPGRDAGPSPVDPDGGAPTPPFVDGGTPWTNGDAGPSLADSTTADGGSEALGDGGSPVPPVSPPTAPPVPRDPFSEP